MQDYVIKLPKQAKGTQLITALRETVSRLKWSYTQGSLFDFVSSGSVNIKPTKVDVWLTPPAAGSAVIRLEPARDYSEFRLVRGHRELRPQISESEVKTFSEALFLHELWRDDHPYAHAHIT